MPVGLPVISDQPGPPIAACNPVIRDYELLKLPNPKVGLSKAGIKVLLTLFEECSRNGNTSEQP